MKKFSVFAVTAIVLLVFAGSAFGGREEHDDFTDIELTEDQISIIVHNCPQDGEITIDLTEDQIAIIIHNFPQIEDISEISVGRENLREDNTIRIVAEGRAGVAVIETR